MISYANAKVKVNHKSIPDVIWVKTQYVQGKILIQNLTLEV